MALYFVMFFVTTKRHFWPTHMQKCAYICTASFKICLAAAECQTPCWGGMSSRHTPLSTTTFSWCRHLWYLKLTTVTEFLLTNATSQSNIVVLQLQQMYLYFWLEQSTESEFIKMSLTLAFNGSFMSETVYICHMNYSKFLWIPSASEHILKCFLTSHLRL